MNPIIRFDLETCKKVKLNTLNNLIQSNIDKPIQGSTKWLESRQYTIGGSEISTIIGDNCYSKADNLVAQKTGLSSFNGNIACRWGKIFEVSTNDITRNILDIDNIYTTGSLNGSVKNQTYSPDGLAVVKIYCEVDIINRKIERYDYCIVLFEYKSPYKSIPSGVIPKHYMPQVKTGLCSIPIADFAIFINNLYRKCSMENLCDSPLYDTNFHNDTNVKLTEPLALGLNIFYQTPEQQILFKNIYDELDSDLDNDADDDTDSESDTQTKFNNIHKKKIQYINITQNILNKIKYKNREFTDLGKSQYCDFNLILELYDKGLLSIQYCDPHIFERYYNNNFLKDQCKKYKYANINDSLKNYHNIIKNFDKINNNILIGVLPWKLFMSDIIYEPREKNYVKKYENIINDTIGIIKDINCCIDKNDKISKFKYHFPKSKIFKNYSSECAYEKKFIPTNI